MEKESRRASKEGKHLCLVARDVPRAGVESLVSVRSGRPAWRVLGSLPVCDALYPEVLFQRPQPVFPWTAAYSPLHSPASHAISLHISLQSGCDLSGVLGHSSCVLASSQSSTAPVLRTTTH